MAERSLVTIENYQDLAERTSATGTPEGIQKIRPRLVTKEMRSAINGIMVRANEEGQKADLVKRIIFYGKDILTDLPEQVEPTYHRKEFTDLEIRLLHAGLGLFTESCEFLDALRISLFEGRGLDAPNLQEECGDLEWYIAEALNALRARLLDILQKNHDKLFERFPDKFTEEKALNRNLENERRVLE